VEYRRASDAKTGRPAAAQLRRLPAGSLPPANELITTRTAQLRRLPAGSLVLEWVSPRWWEAVVRIAPAAPRGRGGGARDGAAQSCGAGSVELLGPLPFAASAAAAPLARAAGGSHEPAQRSESDKPINN